MTPQIVRDRIGWHLVWGEWMLTWSPQWMMRPGHVRRSAHMGETRIDAWVGIGFRIYRVQHGKEFRRR